MALHESRSTSCSHYFGGLHSVCGHCRYSVFAENNHVLIYRTRICCTTQWTINTSAWVLAINSSNNYLDDRNMITPIKPGSMWWLTLSLKSFPALVGLYLNIKLYILEHIDAIYIENNLNTLCLCRFMMHVSQFLQELNGIWGQIQNYRFVARGRKQTNKQKSLLAPTLLKIFYP